MRRLTQSIPVQAPSDFALAFLSTYFLERAPQAEGAELHLRLPLPRFGDLFALDKQVAVKLVDRKDASGQHQLTIRWKPQGRGPFPSFAGVIAAAGTSAEQSVLSIDGEYAPPGGLIGSAFDVVFGNRIAAASIAGLLEQFRTEIEMDYRIRVVP